MIPFFDGTPPDASGLEAVIQARVESWIAFKAELLPRIVSIQKHYDNNSPLPHRLLYRGQCCSDWPLWSSFDRLMYTKKKTGNDVEKIYISMLQDFVRNGIELEMFEEPISKLFPEGLAEKFRDNPAIRRDVETFAQHHGLPTRFLDWTRSPYIASFFAFSECQNQEQSDDVAIWCLDTDGAGGLFLDHDISIIDNPGRGGRRQVWQRGSFTFNWTNEIKLEELFLKRSKKLRSEVKFPVLFKFVMPKSERKVALQDLELMRINYLSVYPDIEGLSKFVKSRLLERL